MKIIYLRDHDGQRRGGLAELDAPVAWSLIVEGIAAYWPEPARRNRSRSVTRRGGGDPLPERPTTGTS